MGKRGPQRWPPGPCSVCAEETEKRIAGKCRNCYARLFAQTPHARAVRRARQYGISEQEFVRLFETQRGRCGVCEKELAAPAAQIGPDTPCVDHDHATGRVRGLLCRKCNAGIGLFGDSADVLKRAIAYLGSYPSG